MDFSLLKAFYTVVFFLIIVPPSLPKPQVLEYYSVSAFTPDQEEVDEEIQSIASGEESPEYDDVVPISREKRNSEAHKNHQKSDEKEEKDGIPLVEKEDPTYTERFEHVLPVIRKRSLDSNYIEEAESEDRLFDRLRGEKISPYTNEYFAPYSREKRSDDVKNKNDDKISDETDLQKDKSDAKIIKEDHRSFLTKRSIGVVDSELKENDAYAVNYLENGIDDTMIIKKDRSDDAKYKNEDETVGLSVLEENKSDLKSLKEDGMNQKDVQDNRRFVFVKRSVGVVDFGLDRSVDNTVGIVGNGFEDITLMKEEDLDVAESSVVFKPVFRYRAQVGQRRTVFRNN